MTVGTVSFQDDGRNRLLSEDIWWYEIAAPLARNDEYMDDIDHKPLDETPLREGDALDEDGEPLLKTERIVSPHMTIANAMDTLALFKDKLVDESYDQMLEDGEAEAQVPLEVVDALEVLLYFVNSSFDMDEEL